MDIDFEIVRLRDWKHDKVDPALTAFFARIRLLEKNQDRLEHRLTRVAKKVDDMIEADKIAEAVAKRVQKRNRLELSIAQKIGGTLLFIVTLTDLLHNIFG